MLKEATKDVKILSFFLVGATLASHIILGLAWYSEFNKHLPDHPIATLWLCSYFSLLFSCTYLSL